jgi:hypothetical protein
VATSRRGGRSQALRDYQQQLERVFTEVRDASEPADGVRHGARVPDQAPSREVGA